MHCVYSRDRHVINRPRAFVTAVVDDDLEVLESLEDLLESAGHRVRSFLSAAAMLESGSLADIDCLISDIDLPGIDGFELLGMATASRPDLAVFLITGHTEMARRTARVRSAHYRLFTKPFNGQELLLAIDHALRRPNLSS